MLHFVAAVREFNFETQLKWFQQSGRVKCSAAANFDKFRFNFNLAITMNDCYAFIYE